MNLNKIDTEKRNINSMNIDKQETKEIIKIINNEDEKVTKAIQKELPNIESLIDAAFTCYKSGGRIIYMGAGTSGRLGVLDASECPPTYGVNEQDFIGIIAGGDTALRYALEGAEDSKELAVDDLKRINVAENDFIIGIAASGRTPYVIGAIEYANEHNIQTGSIAITKESEIGKISNYPIEVSVGPEVVTGSTRMKAGTAQKMILNMISTTIMIKSGKVYENLMIDVKPTNKKLMQRAVNIIKEITNENEVLIKEKLIEANNNVKLATVMILNNYSKDEAINHLEINADKI